MSEKKKEPGTALLTQSMIITRYGVTKKIIETCFPKPIVRYNPKKHWAYTRYWQEKDVLAAMEKPEVRAALEERAVRQRESAERTSAANMLMQYNPASLIAQGQSLKRVFVLHVGPTNSGKTHDALEALKTAGNGTYVGPLRLLALEMFDRLNAAGIPCSLLTGEESIPTDGAEIVSSTIELCDFKKHFKVAVIDEAQLIADGDRGAHWFSAICRVDAEEVHICLAPEALDFIESLVAQFGDPYTVVRHERLVPLEYAGRCRGYKDIQPHDAIICFSRKNVLSTAALLERNGFKASVIYGALPPAARRSEVQRYTSGETDVVVATDAIGMGITLPIRRVIFAEAQKFDGKQQRSLYPGEVRQIAGRAGRYGMFDKGEVLTMDRTATIENGLKGSVRQIERPCIAFPKEVLSSEIPLGTLLRAWQELPASTDFKREDMTDALILNTMLKDRANGKDRELVFSLITCPVDTGLQEMRLYWLRCATAILHNRRIPKPDFETDTLQGCEFQYKAYDIHHQLLMRIGQEDDCTAERDEICKKIRELMEKDKSEYIRRCRVCGKELPLGYSFNVCDKCFGLEFRAEKSRTQGSHSEKHS